MLVSKNGAPVTQGDKVLVWGASGGLGAYAVQYCLNGGATPVGVVSSQSKVDLLHDLGVEAVIDRKAAGYRFWKDEFHQDESEWRRLGKDIRGLVGDDVDIVFEHPGRQTMGASVFAAKRGGTIVTCAATSGYMIEYDNRHLWMKLKTIKGSHFANYREAWDANQLVCEGKILPPLSAVHTLDNVGEAAYQVHRNLHEGKIGVLCLAPEEGLGIDDPELRARGRRGPDHPLPEARGMTEMLLTEIDHVAIAVPDLDAAVAYYERDVRGHGDPPGAHRLRRGRGGAAQGGRQLRPAAHADQRRVAGGQVPGEEGARHPPRRLPGGRLRRRPPVGQGPRRPGHRPGAPSGFTGHHGRLRPSRRVPSAPSSSWSRSSRTRRMDRTIPGRHPRRTPSAARAARPPAAPGAGIGLPHIRPDRRSPRSRCPRSATRSTSTPWRMTRQRRPSRIDRRPVREDPEPDRTAVAASASPTVSFPPGVAAKLAVYVYLLVDPRTGRPFFVGRGRGDRCLRHVEEARAPGPAVAVRLAGRRPSTRSSTGSARPRPTGGPSGSRSCATA